MRKLSITYNLLVHQQKRRQEPGTKNYIIAMRKRLERANRAFDAVQIRTRESLNARLVRKQCPIHRDNERGQLYPVLRRRIVRSRKKRSIRYRELPRLNDGGGGGGGGDAAVSATAVGKIDNSSETRQRDEPSNHTPERARDASGGVRESQAHHQGRAQVCLKVVVVIFLTLLLYFQLVW